MALGRRSDRATAQADAAQLTAGPRDRWTARCAAEIAGISEAGRCSFPRLITSAREHSVTQPSFSELRNPADLFDRAALMPRPIRKRPHGPRRELVLEQCVTMARADSSDRRESCLERIPMPRCAWNKAPLEDKRRYFELIRQGCSGSAASARVGVSLSCGSLWFIDAGSVSYLESPISSPIPQPRRPDRNRRRAGPSGVGQGDCGTRRQELSVSIQGDRTQAQARWPLPAVVRP